MRRLLHHKRILFSLFLALCCGASIAWYAWNQQRNYKHLYAVKTGVLYRSGQLTRKGLERVLYEKNICTVINLCSNGQSKNKKQPDWEEELCFKNFVYYLSIPLGSPDQTHSPVETEQAIDRAVEQFLDIMSDPANYPRPVLIHCMSGIERTGVLAALYRIEKQGWSKDLAIAEMRDLGYRDFTGYNPLRDYLLNWIPLRDRKPVAITSQQK